MAALRAALGRARRWAGTLGRFMLVQSVVQAATVLTGIIIVRFLAKEDYAYYTIGNSWLSALVTLSNSGVSDAATAIAGRVWQDPFRLGQVIRTAMQVRRWLCATAIVPIAGVLIWTLAKNGAGFATISTLTLLVVGAAIFQIAYSILIVVPRLGGEVRRLQHLDLVGAFLRLAMTAAAATLFLDARSAIAVSMLALLVQYLLLRRWALSKIDLQAPVNVDVRRELRRIIARQWPNELNGVFQGQISVLLLSVFGTVTGVADLGALSRISILFVVFGSVMQAVVLPRYARCQDPRQLRSLYIEIMIGFSLLAMLPAAVALIAPQPILWVLGPRYEHLSLELFLLASNAALASIGSVSWNLNTVRAWIIPWPINIPAGLAAQCILIPLIGVSTVRQILLIAIPATAITILTNVVATLIFSRGFTRVGDRRGAFVDVRGEDDAPPRDANNRRGDHSR